MEWIDPNTGEVVDENHEGAIEVEAIPESVMADAQAFGDWITERLVSLEAREQAAKMQFDRIKSQHASERKALERHFSQLEEATATLLTGKKKSVHFAYGTAGFRKSTKKVIDDEQAAIDWAMTECPEAIKVTTKVLKSVLPAKCPHLSVETGEAFYVRAAK